MYSIKKSNFILLIIISAVIGACVCFAVIKAVSFVGTGSLSGSQDAKAFQDIMGADAVCIGRTGGDSLKVASAGISLSVKDMRKAWNDPVWNIMGGAQ